MCHSQHMTPEIERIRSALRSGMIVKTRLAAAAAIHPNTLLHASNDDWSPNASTVRKLIDALDRIGA